jgi:hypothetical protein
MVIGRGILRNGPEGMLEATNMLLLEDIHEILAGENSGNAFAGSSKLTEGCVADPKVGKHI